MWFNTKNIFKIPLSTTTISFEGRILTVCLLSGLREPWNPHHSAPHNLASKCIHLLNRVCFICMRSDRFLDSALFYGWVIALEHSQDERKDIITFPAPQRRLVVPSNFTLRISSRQKRSADISSIIVRIGFTWFTRTGGFCIYLTDLELGVLRRSCIVWNWTKCGNLIHFLFCLSFCIKISF